ncbi:hypothetical protein RB200_06375 [Streptomyces sp. PmtG]
MIVASRGRGSLTELPLDSVSLAVAARADLLVVSAQRQRGPHGLPLGQAAHTLPHHSACPVSAVPRAA